MLPMAPMSRMPAEQAGLEPSQKFGSGPLAACGRLRRLSSGSKPAVSIVLFGHYSFFLCSSSALFPGPWCYKIVVVVNPDLWLGQNLALAALRVKVFIINELMLL